MKVLQRSEAVDKGLKRYFTGRPCKRGHMEERLTSNNICVGCKKEKESIRVRPSDDRTRELAMINYYKRTEGKIFRPTKQERAEKRRAYLAYYMREKRRTDDLFCLKDRIRRRINKELAVRGQCRVESFEVIVGCSVIDLGAHIEAQFQKGMDWSNRGKWHIDHIIPISSAKTEEEVLALNHHTNLRPMWATDNLRKSNKMEYLI